MKSVDYLNSKVLYILFIYFFLSSCDDQNFDWDAVHNQGNESLYESLFTSLFGGIDPDQSWDFSEGTKLEETRAGESSYMPVLSGDSAYYYVQAQTLTWMKENLPESGTSFCYTGSDEIKHPNKDNSFILYLPETGFKITPIYQGRAGCWDLYMVVKGANGEDIHLKIWSKSSELSGIEGYNFGDYDPKTFFQFTKNTCSSCHGTGIISSNEECEVCGGDGRIAIDGASQATCVNDNNSYKYFKLRTYIYNDRKTTTYSIYDENNVPILSTSGADVFAFIKLDNKTYLYNVNREYYLKYDNGISSTTNILEASETKLENDKLIINGYYAYNINGTLSFNSSSSYQQTTYVMVNAGAQNAYETKYYALINGNYYLVNSRTWHNRYYGGGYYTYYANGTDVTNYNTFYRQETSSYSAAEWTQSFFNATNEWNQSVSSALAASTSKSCTACSGTGKVQVICNNCHGSGGTTDNGTWYNVAAGEGVNTWNEAKTAENPKNTMNATAVRSKSLVWGTDTYSPLPAYTAAYFYLKITSTSANFSETDAVLSSLNNHMVLLSCPTPSNVPQNHQVAIIGCEDAHLNSVDWDYNDIVFLMEGLPLLPLTSLSSSGSTGQKTFTINERSKKRYMVEDMGFGSIVDSDENAKESTAVKNNYTDIDFNDIVVDFEQSRTVTHTITVPELGEENGGLKVGDEASVTADTTTATIRALGGTWDFQLAIGGDNDATPIFQKSLASTSAYNVKNSSTTVQCPKVEFNPEYQLVESEGIGALDARIMYNTGQATNKRGDGIYDYNTWIAKITNIGVGGAINKWDATTNNVHFNLIDDTSDTDLKSGSSANVKEGTSTTTSGVTTYHVDFPSIGACPKIIAFPITKKWQRERIHVTKDWFNDSTNAVNSD